jgi:hypothetical protein
LTFFFWGYTPQLVYQDKSQMSHELLRRITAAAAAFTRKKSLRRAMK